MGTTTRGTGASFGRRVALAWGLAALLAACGGGGGGGGGGSLVTVSGVVLDSNGHPVAGATVTITSNPVVVTTAADGSFSADVPPGSHHIAVEKGGTVFCEQDFDATEGDPAMSLGDLTPTTPYVDTGGGGGGGGGSPAIPGFDFALAKGDFWEFAWHLHESSFDQTGGSSSDSRGLFRVTLGDPETIGGKTLFPVEVSGRPGHLAPRWSHIGIADNVVWGVKAGGAPQPLFDAVEGFWPGGGFFGDGQVDSATYDDGYADGDLVRATAGSASHELLTDTGLWVTSDRASEGGGCEFYPGVGTICPYDEAIDLSRDEFWKPGVGPVGYEYHLSFIFTGGGFTSGGSTDIFVGVTASSRTGDTADHVIEEEPNDLPAQAQAITLPAVVLGETRFQDMATPLPVSLLSEFEPNDGEGTAQVLPSQAVVTGAAAVGDSGTAVPLPVSGNPDYTPTVEDWYRFSGVVNKTVTIGLDFTGATGSDLDLVLFEPFAGNLFEREVSLGDNVGTGDYTESISYMLPATTEYLIAVDAYLTPGGSVPYTLTLDAGTGVSVEDLFRFTLASAGTVNVDLAISDPGVDLDVYLLDNAAADVLDSSIADNIASGDATESLSTPLAAGTYLLAVDHFAGPYNDVQAYTLTVSPP